MQTELISGLADLKIEIAITKIVEKIIDKVEVKSYENLYQIGFDSVKTLNLVAKIEETFNIAFSDDELLLVNFKTINEITEKVYIKLKKINECSEKERIGENEH
ncbi:acyl carrier protein [Paenibacillus apiarius]|uniref:Acyl carrier protein n=1 Tax=Paenibacillus apiarius TaxID=46240 RepID=A0ABT4DR16_9BACL|nr:acyl carrier protein [Paenibacillus apiarius]MCY9516230.1 acyl carrier protein [Paenibacillus apiarius]MCY9519764.1 acyl carrier protein [Paenibacillus apiarius]MCY9555290.1 acyl carrier protein [Paenibacillus apiarius]MCY9559351.1 acyl carrier protein [Paenibacillus apiarius]MCY9682710.1 acyl carrier protein [Paenibacillus apiarius]